MFANQYTEHCGTFPSDRPVEEEKGLNFIVIQCSMNLKFCLRVLFFDYDIQNSAYDYIIFTFLFCNQTDFSWIILGLSVILSGLPGPSGLIYIFYEKIKTFL